METVFQSQAHRWVGNTVRDAEEVERAISVGVEVRQLLLDLQSAVNVDIFMAEFIEAARGGPAE